MTFTPLRNYAGYHHVLGAAPCFVHLKNGNVYYWACEQKAGKQQNLTIYREVVKTGAWETVVTFRGTFDAESFIERGGCVIDQTGALRVATTLTPKGVPWVTGTGFQGVRCIIPDVDEPWSLDSSGGAGNDPRVDALVSQLGALGQQVSQLQAGGGMQLLPAPRTSPAWDGRTLTGGVEVDVPTVFGVPSAKLYHIRFVAVAQQANIRVRAGTREAPHFVTLNTQVANNPIPTNGDAPGPLVWVSVVDGNGKPATAQIWLQICGFSQ